MARSCGSGNAISKEPPPPNITYFMACFQNWLLGPSSVKKRRRTCGKQYVSSIPALFVIRILTSGNCQSLSYEVNMLFYGLVSCVWLSPQNFRSFSLSEIDLSIQEGIILKQVLLPEAFRKTRKTVYWNQIPPPSFTLVTCSTYLTLKMEAYSSETSIDFQRNIRRYT
jgi:hypothetical protein